MTNETNVSRTAETNTARWYCVNTIGMATLCRDEADAIREAAEADVMWTRHAPHVATQLVPATPSSSVARRVSAEMQAEIERLHAENDKMLVALNAALGIGSKFPLRREGDPPYWWRGWLQEFAGLEYDGTRYTPHNTELTRAGTASG